MKAGREASLFAGPGAGFVAGGGGVIRADPSCAVIARGAASLGFRPAGAVIGTFGAAAYGPSARSAGGTAIPTSVRTFPIASGLRIAARSPSGAIGEPRSGESITFVTVDDSWIADVTFGGPALPPTRTAAASSGTIEAGIHSAIPGFHTSVAGSINLLASAARSSSVPTSRWTPLSSVHLHSSPAVNVRSVSGILAR